VVVDKTAQFVARNGKGFEERILNSDEGKTAKFHFLKTYHPFHAYYVKRIRDYEEGKEGEDELEAILANSDSNVVKMVEQKDAEEEDSMEVVESAATPSLMTQPTLINPLSRFAHEDVSSAPPALEFSVATNLGLSGVDVDTIKLTAQYAAANGSDFISKLMERERDNSKFDFLNPLHALFAYFSRLVDIYRRIITGAPELKVAIDRKSDFEAVLRSAVHRWNWAITQEEKAKGSVESLMVDWKDFVVVETITFDDDELLTEAASIGAVAAASEPRIASSSSSSSSSSSTVDSGEGMAVEIEGAAIVVETVADMHAEIGMDSGGLNVVSEYQPRLAGTGPDSGLAGTMVDPISGRVVPVEQISEHMKAQLVDPRGRVEHQRFVDKQKETGVAAGDSMVSSLMQFAEKRRDIVRGSNPAPTESAVPLPVEGLQPRPPMPPPARMHGLQPVVQRPPVMMPPHAAGGALGYGPPGMPQLHGMGSVPPPPQAPVMAQQPAQVNARGVSNMPAWMTQQQQQQPPPPPAAKAAAPVSVSVSRSEEPELKRARVEAPADATPAPSRVGGVTITLQVQCAEDSANPQFNLNGQVLDIPAVSTDSTIKVLKGQISAVLGMPPNKMNLQLPGAGSRDFIKDTLLVQDAGLVNGSTVLLGARMRGGR
jgi:splicing factor 3A subunit 1